jgi:hypothetical protein
MREWSVTRNRSGSGVSAIDTDALKRAAEVLAPQVEAVLDVWNEFVGGSAHLVTTFAGPDVAWMQAA